MAWQACIRVDEIAAAHHLPGYPGNCAAMHGHNWTFEAVVNAEALHADMVVDFAVIKAVFKAVDHTCLNDDAEVTADGHRATTERLAQVLAARVQRALDAQPNRPRVVELRVRETSRNEVVYRP